MKRELNEKDLSENDKLAKVRNELEAENRKLNDQLYKLNSEYKAKIDELESQKSQETQTIIDNLIKQNEVKHGSSRRSLFIRTIQSNSSI